MVRDHPRQPNKYTMIKCLAPWVHRHISSTGIEKPCCVARVHEHDPKLMNDVRKTFLNGEIPKGICDSCFGSRANRPEDNRYFSFFEKKYKHHLDEILSKTNSSTGETTFEPLSFDIRSNVCNLSCRICYSDSSTRIAAHENDQSNIKPKKFSGNFIPHMENGDSVYWAGGEPLLNPLHWNVMDRVIKNKNSCQLFYSTNACVSDKVWNKFVADVYSKHIGEIIVFGSCDGFDEIGEFLRTGFITSLYKQRILQLQNTISPAYRNVSVDVTVTNVGLFSLPHVIQWCKDNSINLSIKDMQCHLKNEYLSVQLLPIDIVKQCIAKIDNVLIDAPKNISEPVENLLKFIYDRHNQIQWTERHQNMLDFHCKTKKQPLSNYSKVKEIFDGYIIRN